MDLNSDISGAKFVFHQDQEVLLKLRDDSGKASLFIVGKTEALRHDFSVLDIKIQDCPAISRNSLPLFFQKIMPVI